jgi:hypothetical protein
MELREFIRGSLVDIAIGVQQAAIDAKELVAIAPGDVNGKPIEQLEKIEFDVAVTVAEDSSTSMESGGDVGGRLKVVGIEIGGSLKESDTTAKTAKREEVSRIKFSVPVLLNLNFANDTGFSAREAQVKSAIGRIDAISRQSHPPER